MKVWVMYEAECGGTCNIIAVTTDQSRAKGWELEYRGTGPDNYVVERTLDAPDEVTK